MVFAGFTLPLYCSFYVFHIPGGLILHHDAHASGSTGDHAHSRLDASGIQIRHLHLRDLANLILGDGSYLRLVGHSGTGLQVAGLLQKNCCRRSLGDEAEASVRVNGDYYGDDQVTLISRSGVELLCKLNNIYSVLTQGRTNWGGRSCFASRDL